ncbi:hypothetical protein SAMN04489732_120101 [Amycolatopsis saalfeldensis]|uniref:Uncharacterized protein n=1 Tax=Amycolatopsis saalfeldensis TaxID=394193 RepID=A0A1H8YM17_9PSEU|nr:hypothetical protein SAMN04489732_120101 [Amycolatopsis saalfeldensis]
MRPVVFYAFAAAKSGSKSLSSIPAMNANHSFTV